MEFPCQFPIKAMGLASDDFDALVVELILRHVDKLNEGAVKTKNSSSGKYTSVTVTFEATSQEQLDKVYLELTGHERVLTTL
ncbi:YbeD family protein [Pseudomonadota bacterium]